MGIRASAAAPALESLANVAFTLANRIHGHVSHPTDQQDLLTLMSLLNYREGDFRALADRLASWGDSELSDQAVASLRKLWDLFSGMVAANSEFLGHMRARPTRLDIPGSPFPAADTGAETTLVLVHAEEEELLRYAQMITPGMEEASEEFLRVLAAFDACMNRAMAVFGMRQG